MKAAVVTSPGDIEIWDISRPQCQDYQAVVKQLGCSICNGTDLKIVEGRFKGNIDYPVLLGHEGIGRVVEKGKRVKNFNIGDMLLHTQLGIMGTRYRISNKEDIVVGSGAFAEYALAGDWKAMHEDGIGENASVFSPIYYTQQRLMVDLEPSLATMIITLKEVMSAIRRFRFTPNASLLVFGDGPVGLSFVWLSKSIGMVPVVCCGHHDSRLKAAKRLGAEQTIELSGGNIPAQVLEQTQGQKFEFIIDAIGIPELINESLELIKEGGRVSIYGISSRGYHTKIDWNWNRAPRNFLIEFGQGMIFSEEAAVHQEVVNLVSLQPDLLKEFITHVLPLEQIEKGVELIKRRKAIKVAIETGIV